MFSRLQGLMQPKQQQVISPLEIKGEIFTNQQKKRAFSADDEAIFADNLITADNSSTHGSSNLNEFMSDLVRLAEYEDDADNEAKNRKV